MTSYEEILAMNDIDNHIDYMICELLFWFIFD